MAWYVTLYEAFDHSAHEHVCGGEITGWQFKDLDRTAERCRWISEKSWHKWGDNHCVRCMPNDVTPVGMDLLFIKTNRYVFIDPLIVTSR
jgi:hypothetical protein